MKAIKFQGTNEKMSSRPLSSLYVDDADEEDEEGDQPSDINILDDHQSENNIQEQAPYEGQESMPVSQDPSEIGENLNIGHDINAQQID